MRCCEQGNLSTLAGLYYKTIEHVILRTVRLRISSIRRYTVGRSHTSWARVFIHATRSLAINTKDIVVYDEIGRNMCFILSRARV